ncbi:MAG: O-antigen ligase family protein [Verrucomicrobiaceae bacterium]|nr:O-antigen ligase family protein [Verrucomicrobiaceae bacterium]
MLVYAGYIVFSSNESSAIAFEVFSLVMFFFLTLHAVTNEEKLSRVMTWWMYALVGVVVIACSVMYGFDFTTSKPVTDGNVGRLSLNSWLLNNPNALGHTLASLLPMLFFAVIGKSKVITKVLSLLVGVFASICLWETQSKGALIVAATGVLLCFLIGRAWWWKLGVLAIAIGAGGTLLSKLPRMEKFASLKDDEGIAGRILAWQMARGVTRTAPTGEGFKNFAALIEWEGETIPKATHSSYVKIGADLGSPGLLLYLSVMCVSIRTLLVHRGHTPRMRRSRDVLLALLSCYMLSGWMIDRAYHTEFFVLAGAIAAFHRLSLKHLEELASEVETKQPTPAERAWQWLETSQPEPEPILVPALPFKYGGISARIRGWRRYGLLDFLVAYAAMEATYWTWDYVILEL